MKKKPFAVHRLPNGWEVREFHAVKKHVFCEEPATPGREGKLGRFVVMFARRHHVKRLTITHLIGSSAKDQARSLRTAIGWASRPTRFPMQGLWSRHRDSHYPGKTVYFITLGDGVDEESAFASISMDFNGTSEIDLEFQALVERFLLDQQGVTL